ncbi:hypothetical protein L2E82_05379 [Cichorium intybus]|uniref:Uncharacterized protein n=1 Tax=Cichorium intybus TaxID=13427 RepID=A0ACB9H8A1_CICIN|nr:hypothetical protein L2E82_05379 [Cichorium intybus]
MLHRHGLGGVKNTNQARNQAIDPLSSLYFVGRTRGGGVSTESTSSSRYTYFTEQPSRCLSDLWMKTAVDDGYDCRVKNELVTEELGMNLDNVELEMLGSFEKVFLFQKAALYKCNIAGNPAVVTRLVDSMTDNLRATRAEATDVGNAVLDGNFFFPVETLVKWIVETKLSTNRTNTMNNYGVVLDNF